jgi:hypothetical protein
MWILIILLAGTVEYIQFNDMNACEYAATKIEASSAFRLAKGYSICVPRGFPR